MHPGHCQVSSGTLTCKYGISQKHPNICIWPGTNTDSRLHPPPGRIVSEKPCWFTFISDAMVGTRTNFNVHNKLSLTSSDTRACSDMVAIPNVIPRASVDKKRTHNTCVGVGHDCFLST